MTTIRIDSNAGDVARWIREIRSDQAPFALSSAINATAKQAQQVQREHQRGVFQIRRSTFSDRAVKIKPFAVKSASPFAILRVEPPGGSARAGVLIRHEEDRQREPEGRSLIVPAKQGSARVIRRRSDPLHPSKWKMKRRDSGRSRFEVYQGANGLYMVRLPDGSGVVRQRVGPGPEGSVPVFFLRPSTPLDQRLDFVENITGVVEENWDRHIGEAWDKALRTAR